MKQFNKRPVKLEDYYSHILLELRRGISVTASAGGRTNPMAISWGMLGIEWNKPVFITVVRTGRFTHKLLEQNPEFTINIPMDTHQADIIRYIGTHSGRDEDKVAALGLHLVSGETVSVPGIAELPLTLECRVAYRQLQDSGLFLLDDEVMQRMYPQHIPSEVSSSNCDFHTAFYGEITGVHLIE